VITATVADSDVADSDQPMDTGAGRPAPCGSKSPEQEESL